MPAGNKQSGVKPLIFHPLWGGNKEMLDHR